VPPKAVNVAVEPTQMTVGLELAVTVGLAITLILIVLVDVQPKLLVPTAV
jgi:hypothetical protein